MNEHIGKHDYIGVLNLLRDRYNMTGKDGETLVSCEELKNGDISYKVFKALAVKVLFRRSFTRLLIKNAILKNSNVDLGTYFLHPIKSIPDMQALDLEREDDIVSYIINYLDIAIQNYDAPKKFGCCSRYKECSDKKECINPNKIRAKQCFYRDNLEKGNIFY